MKWGLTTGTCAALAAKAAATLLLTGQQPRRAEVTLPDGERVSHPVHDLALTSGGASASILKDAGDDPDVTHGALLTVTVRLNGMKKNRFLAGHGVGTVTRSGLAVQRGEAAINPGPRKMIRQALKELCEAGFDVTVSVPDGEHLAQKTYNPRLGVVGGISILGTTGRVRPFSAPAFREALKCSLNVAVAEGSETLVAVPGNIGHQAALDHFGVDERQIVDVSNEWGFMLAEIAEHDFERLLVLGHPGKLGKLAMGQWQTHSARSESPVGYIRSLCRSAGAEVDENANTVEELFMDHCADDERSTAAGLLAGRIHEAVISKYPDLPETAVVLTNLKGEIIGSYGDLAVWEEIAAMPGGD